jgi:hypothetical protein
MQNQWLLTLFFFDNLLDTQFLFDIDIDNLCDSQKIFKTNNIPKYSLFFKKITKNQ